MVFASGWTEVAHLHLVGQIRKRDQLAGQGLGHVGREHAHLDRHAAERGPAGAPGDEDDDRPGDLALTRGGRSRRDDPQRAGSRTHDDVAVGELYELAVQVAGRRAAERERV